MKAPSLLLATSLLAFVQGCSVIHYQSRGVVPLTFSGLPGHNRKVVIERTKEFYLFGFLPATNEVFVDEDVKGEGYESMSRLKIVERTTWKDWLAGIATLGLFVPRSYTISGLVPESRRNSE